MRRNAFRRHRWACIAAAAAFSISLRAVDYYVSPDGNDAWSGLRNEQTAVGEDGPFATLARVRDAIRERKAAGALTGPVTVHVRHGIYPLRDTLELTEADSGTPEAPITYRGPRKSRARISGGRAVEKWHRVEEPGVLRRLRAPARAHVLQADLKALGIDSFGDMVSAAKWAQSRPGLEVFFEDAPMTLARWPNTGMAKIAGFPTGAKRKVLWGKTRPNTSVEPAFHYDGEHQASWLGEPAIMLHGYWFWDWADQRYRVASIDPATKTIHLDREHHYGLRKGQGYYAYNLLCELDRPGEWYLDREQGILYFWPPADIRPGSTAVSERSQLVTLTGASHVTFLHLTFEAAQDTAITIREGAKVRIAGCVIRNCGSWGVRIAGGRDHSVVGCDLYDLGDGGVAADSGDRKYLRPGRHAVENSHIHHYSRWDPMYKPGVSLSGVGNRVSSCLIHNAPHMGVSCRGNDHVVEFSELHSLVYHANDAEAIHGGYNDWTYRGTVVRHNYIHDCYGHEGHGCKAIRLDNYSGGLTIYGNVVERIWCEGGRGAYTLHGSRDTLIENNLFVDCDRAIRVHKCRFPAPYERLERMPFRTPPWSDRYPALARLLEDDPELPKGNVVVRNVNSSGDFLSTDKVAADLVRVENNVPNQDRTGILRSPGGIPYLDRASPAWKLGFKPIPIARIGLYAGELRASWPVSHSVRPPPERPRHATQRKSKPRTRKGPAPRLAAGKTDRPVTPDGVLGAEEWTAPEIPAREQPSLAPVTGEPAGLRVSYDAANLYVAVRVPVSDVSKLTRTEDWGAADGAEVCLRRLGKGVPGPTFVLQGFLTGQFVASPDAGAHAEDIFRLTKAVTFGAKVYKREWVGEWVIPFRVLDVTPQPGLSFGFNLGVHRSAGREWVVWVGTSGPNWQLDRAGILTLK